MIIKYDIAIIGGGPAGIMAALSAKRQNKDCSICIIERNSSIGKKLRMTGGGRCNFTNNKDISQFFDNIVNNEKFLYSAIYTYTNEDIKKYIREIGLDYSIEENNEDKVYLKSGNSQDLIDAFWRELKRNEIDVFCNEKLSSVDLDRDTKILSCTNIMIECKKVIFSCGGMSYPETGSDGSVIYMLKNKGYSIKNLVAALTPINIKEKWLCNIPGISIEKVDISILKVNTSNNKKRIHKTINGDIVFTHKGIGGPAALKISSYINRSLKESAINIDFIPKINYEELYSIIKLRPKKTILGNLKEILPNNFIKIVLEKCEEESSSKYSFTTDQSSNLSKRDFDILAKYLKMCEVNPISIGNLDRATITSGGIDVSNINSSTMESNIHKGVFFAGEIIDVDALTGGYNLQIAFSTGYLAGLSASEF